MLVYPECIVFREKRAISFHAIRPRRKPSSHPSQASDVDNPVPPSMVISLLSSIDFVVVEGAKKDSKFSRAEKTSQDTTSSWRFQPS